MNIKEQEEFNKKLIKYSKEGNLELVQHSIEQGADIHVQGDAALRVAANDNHIEVVKYLVKQGADIHAQDDGALRWAADEGCLEVVKYLVEQGADIYAQDDGTFKMAALNNRLEVLKYFLFDCCMKIQKDTKNWLIKNQKKEVLDLIEKRDLFNKINKDLNEINKKEINNKRIKL